MFMPPSRQNIHNQWEIWRKVPACFQKYIIFKHLYHVSSKCIMYQASTNFYKNALQQHLLSTTGLAEQVWVSPTLWSCEWTATDQGSSDKSHQSHAKIWRAGGNWSAGLVHSFNFIIKLWSMLSLVVLLAFLDVLSFKFFCSLMFIWLIAAGRFSFAVYGPKKHHPICMLHMCLGLYLCMYVFPCRPSNLGLNEDPSLLAARCVRAGDVSRQTKTSTSSSE